MSLVEWKILSLFDYLWKKTSINTDIQYRKQASDESLIFLYANSVHNTIEFISYLRNTSHHNIFPLVNIPIHQLIIPNQFDPIWPPMTLSTLGQVG